MSKPVKRAYRSAIREEAAQRTRRSVRDTAARLFVANGTLAVRETRGADKVTITLKFDDGQTEQVAVDGCKLLS